MRAVSLTDETMEAALAFSRTNYRAQAYQAQASYLGWLYEDNPWSTGHEACRLLLQEERVVGILHNMQLPVDIDGTECRLSVLHNLILDPEFRSGMGILFARQEVSRQELMFAPGMQGAYREAFRKFNYQEIKGVSLRRVLRPFSGAVVKAGRKAGIMKDTLSISRKQAVSTFVDVPSVVRENFARRSELNTIMKPEDVGPFVEWRYFSKRGPRSILIHDEASDAYCLCSIGVRRDFNVARILELVGASPAFLSDVVVPALRKLNVHMLLAFAWQDGVVDQLTGIKMQVISNPVSSFQAGKLSKSVEILPQSGISDYGFEAILTT